MILVVKAQDVSVANNWMKENIDPQGGEFTFTIPLYDVNNAVAYYWCGIELTTEQFDILPDTIKSYDKAPNEVLQELNVNLGEDK